MISFNGLLYLHFPDIFSAGWVKINGSIFIKEDGTPLCAMVLINGQYMFSCNDPCTNNETGNYNLIAPLNDDGELSIMGFCEGYASFTSTISPEPGAETEFDIDISPLVISPP